MNIDDTNTAAKVGRGVNVSIIHSNFSLFETAACSQCEKCDKTVVHARWY